MKCREYFDSCFEQKADDYIQEAYWERNFNTDTLFDMMIRDAKRKGISFEDEEEWNYDKFFYDLYKDTEKGLS